MGLCPNYQALLRSTAVPEVCFRARRWTVTASPFKSRSVRQVRVLSAGGGAGGGGRGDDGPTQRVDKGEPHKRGNAFVEFFLKDHEVTWFGKLVGVLFVGVPCLRFLIRYELLRAASVEQGGAALLTSHNFTQGLEPLKVSLDNIQKSIEELKAA